MPGCESNDIAYLIVVDTFSVAGIGTTSTSADVDEVSAPDRLVGLGRESVELEIDGRADVSKTCQEAIVPSDSNAVGVEHYHGDALVERHPHHRQDVRVDGGLAAAELDDLGRAFELYEAVQHPLDLCEGQAEAGLGVGEADGTVQIAVAVDFDEAEAGVLLVLRTQAAVFRASVDDLCAVSQRRGPGLL